MPVWRCPHCATPQPETSRCWVCRRSTTSCATCRHFRRGVAGGLGLCGLDPRHPALTGSEMRACWVAAVQRADPPERLLVAVGPDRPGGRDEIPGSASGRQPRTFVPVEPAAATARARAGDEAQAGVTTDGALAHPSTISPATGTPGQIPGTWWLWGDPEPWPDL
ncbi:MAG TPA: hypothetical protein VES19_12095 [Candidatus Limnocylindrales bacterium]|nr:hypothetical protein [Candidatus Limnocylindrales bacterium]